jgi:YidC/Oxa1 family membrane protein insertase
MMKEDNRNLLLAIALSVVILLGWQFFYAKPQMEKQQEIARQNQQAQSQAAPAGEQPGRAPPGQPAGSAAPQAPGAAAAQVGTREQALAASPRIKIDTPKIAGSISLTGAHRRRLAQGLSRDRRSEQPDHRAALAGRRTQRLLLRFRLGRGAGHNMPCRTPRRSGPPTSRC